MATNGCERGWWVVVDPSRRFLLGVQWHPEDQIYRETARHLFEAFATAVFDKRPVGTIKTNL